MKYVKIRTQKDVVVSYGIFDMSNSAHVKAVYEAIKSGALVTLTAYTSPEDEEDD